MATVDSGTETLFSDDSPCDLGEELEAPVHVRDDVRSRLAPPNIQPYSGVLEKGKIVIRPIAFKPAVLSPASRFSMTGERYGSTPILTRPGSRLTLYGSSNEINCNVNNYSLDRKLRSSCQSVASSPPMATCSLTSLPHKLMNYDSLESVRKSPASTLDGSLMNKSVYRTASSLLDLTPSPSDSGVSELEAALRDRDSELAYLRQTMEHNEQVIFRVYQEKEKSWEREIRRLKQLHENALRSSAQKLLKLEQMMMMQNYQFQQERKRLAAEAQRAVSQNDRLLQEVNLLKAKLEESEWNFCQKSGEIALLKSQLKDCQSEQTTKSHEMLQLKNDFRDMRELLDNKESELDELREGSTEKDKEIEDLRKQLSEMQYKDVVNIDDISENERLRRELKELREELSEVSMSEYEGMEPGRTHKKIEEVNVDAQRLIEEEAAKQQVLELRQELARKKREFERERIVWAEEKEKVLKYQRQLQINYVHMYRRTRTLESELENLAIELKIDKKTVMKELTHQTVDL